MLGKEDKGVGVWKRGVMDEGEGVKVQEDGDS